MVTRHLLDLFPDIEEPHAEPTTIPVKPILNERRTTMRPSLGKMSAYKVFSWRDRAGSSVEQTVATFLELGEAIATRWIQTRKGALLLQMVPDDGASGAIYVFDRQREQRYVLLFESSLKQR